MAILRKNKKSDYTIIDNNIFKNKTLSLKAKGMICTMLSLPDGWEFSEEGLTKLSNDGISSIRSTLKELMEFGYLVRERNRDEKGILRDTTYTIFEEPTLENPILDYPILENENNKILYNKELNKLNEFNLYNNFNENVFCDCLTRNGTKCLRKSSFNINGKNHCNQHARDLIPDLQISDRFKKPTLEEVEEYCKERNNGINAESFIDFYESKGWKVGKTPMKDWKAAVRNWERNRKVKKENKVPEWFDKKIESEEIDDETRRLIEEIEGA